MSSLDHIISTVEHLTEKYDTRDPIALCKDLGIAVRYKDCGATLKAYFITIARIRNIVLSNRLGSAATRVLAAHELGHAVLHRETAKRRGFREFDVLSGGSIEEYEANIFAAELLIDDEELLSLLRDNEFSFLSAARALYVPPELLDFKFRALRHKGYGIEAPVRSSSDFLKRDIDERSDYDFAE